MAYRLVDLPPPVAQSLAGWLGETGDEVWICGVPPESAPPEALVLGLDCEGEGLDVTLPSEQLSPSLLRLALAWARERRELRRELEHERQRATEILATVSHEMRNPVTVMNFMAQLAADNRVSAEQKQDHLGTLRTAARNLLTLLNDLLDFARLGKGVVALTTSDFSLRKCIDDALVGQRLVAEDKGLTLDWQVDPAVPEVLVGDPGRLRQILVNLTGNAVKFTSQGGVLVTATWQEPDRLQLAVRDTGIGIAPEQLQQIFEPYIQAAPTTTKKYGGTGLGLTITRQLVELMQGEVRVESALGQGTTFRVEARLGRPVSSSRPDLDDSCLQGLPVLVFSQNPLVGHALKACGVEQTLVDTPEQLLERAPGFSLLVFDLGVQHSTPFSWVQQLRERCPFEQLRVLVFTAAGQRGDALRCQELQVSAYLTEPLEQQDWREALALTVTGSQSQLITRHLLRELR